MKGVKGNEVASDMRRRGSGAGARLGTRLWDGRFKLSLVSPSGILKIKSCLLSRRKLGGGDM